METELVEDATFYHRGGKLATQLGVKPPLAPLTPRRAEALKASASVLDEIITRKLRSTTEAALESLRKFLGTYLGSLIPTACVFAGVNTLDHSELFFHISVTLQQTEDVVVLRLKSEDCGTPELAVGRLISSLPAPPRAKTEEEDGDDTSSSTKIGKRAMRASTRVSTRASQALEENTSFRRAVHLGSGFRRKDIGAAPDIIRNWYASYKAKKIAKGLAVLIDDADVFPKEVVSTLVSLLHHVKEAVPARLILGSSTPAGLFLRSFPKKDLDRLCIQSVELRGSLHIVDELVEELVVDGALPLRLSRRALDRLTEHFLHSTLSAKAFANSLRFLLVEHFYSVPAAAVCVSLPHVLEVAQALSKAFPDLAAAAIGCMEKGLKKSKAEDVSTGEGEAAQTLRRACHLYAWSLPVEDRRQVLSLASMKEYKERAGHSSDEGDEGDLFCIGEALFSLVVHQMGYRAALEAVLQLLRQLQSPWTRGLRRAMLEFFSSGSDTAAPLVQLETQVKASTKDHLKYALQGALLKLKTAAKVILVDGKATNMHVHFAFQDIIEKGHNILRTADSEDAPSKDASSSNVPSHWTSAKRRRILYLQARERHAGGLERLRQEVMEWVKEMARTRLCPPNDLPLFEAVTLTSDSSLRRVIEASPRAAVIKALRLPQSYLESKKKASDKPRVASVFEALVEAGKTANIADLYLASADIEEDEEEESKSRRSASKSRAKSGSRDEETQKAEFLVAVKELARAGFVKPTSRKQDHLARTAFDIAW